VPVHAVAVQPDGKVIAAAGDHTSDGWASGGNVILARLLADPPPGTRTYEAEQSAISGAAVSRIHPGFTGAGYVDFAHATGDSIEFTVDAPSAGSYVLTFRYANGGAAARPMELRVSGVSSPLRVNFQPTGSWRTWNSESLTVPMIAGANKVRLLATGQSGPNLDSLSAGAVVPPAPATYEAESAVLSGPLVLSNVPGFTGTGFADYQHGSGDFVEFTINAPAAGTYALGFRYANGGTADRPLDLSVDGQVLDGQMSFSPTGAWRTWNSATRSVLLTAGRHTVRLTATGRNGPNLDSLTVRAG
jgi:hypothetical protein